MVLQWLRRLQDARRLAQADAEALIRDRGAGAYSEARQREYEASSDAHEASSDTMVKHWRRVALAIAKKTGERVGVDTATRMLGRDDID